MNSAELDILGRASQALQREKQATAYASTFYFALPKSGEK
jgi:hypothetical protein